MKVTGPEKVIMTSKLFYKYVCYVVMFPIPLKLIEFCIVVLGYYGFVLVSRFGPMYCVWYTESFSIVVFCSLS